MHKNTDTLDYIGQAVGQIMQKAEDMQSKVNGHVEIKTINIRIIHNRQTGRESILAQSSVSVKLDAYIQPLVEVQQP